MEESSEIASARLSSAVFKKSPKIMRKSCPRKFSLSKISEEASDALRSENNNGRREGLSGDPHLVDTKHFWPKVSDRRLSSRFVPESFYRNKVTIV